MKAEDNQFPYVTLAESAAPPSTPGAGLVRAYVDADDGRLYLVDDAGVAHPVAFTTDAAGALGDLTDVDTTGAAAGQVLGTTDGSTWGPVTPSSGGGGGILAAHAYAPATAADYSTTSTSFADVDAANMVLTFTAPTTGAVVIAATFDINMGGSTVLMVNLRNGTTNVANTARRIARRDGGTSNPLHMTSTAQWLVTGLTPGEPYSFKLGFARTEGSNYAGISVGNGSTWGAAVITATEAPA